jgi:hypothetical protein
MSVHDTPLPTFTPEHLRYAELLDHGAPVYRVLEPNRFAQDDIREVLADRSRHFLMRAYAIDVLSRHPIQPGTHLRPSLRNDTAQASRQRDVAGVRPQRLERTRLAVHQLHLGSFHFAKNGVEALLGSALARRGRLCTGAGRTTDEHRSHGESDREHSLHVQFPSTTDSIGPETGSRPDVGQSCVDEEQARGAEASTWSALATGADAVERVAPVVELFQTGCGGEVAANGLTPQERVAAAEW